GYPATKGAGKVLPLARYITFKAGKNLAAYYQARLTGIEANTNDYATFEVETLDELKIGDKVKFIDTDLYVASVTISRNIHKPLNEPLSGLSGDLANFSATNLFARQRTGLKYSDYLVYTATLVKEPLLQQLPIYNKKLRGATLKGKVLEVKEQTVKLELEIDTQMKRTQKVDEAFPFPFSPPTTDMMYLMPQLDTIAELYVPDLLEANAIVTGMLRTNGANCDKTSDPNIRYLATENKKELKIAPEGIYLTSGEEDLALKLDNAEGVTLFSKKKLTLSAEEEVLIHAEGKLAFETGSQIGFIVSSNSFALANEADFKAGKVEIIPPGGGPGDSNQVEAEENKGEEEVLLAADEFRKKLTQLQSPPVEEEAAPAPADNQETEECPLGGECMLKDPAAADNAAASDSTSTPTQQCCPNIKRVKRLPGINNKNVGFLNLNKRGNSLCTLKEPEKNPEIQEALGALSGISYTYCIPNFAPVAKVKSKFKLNVLKFTDNKDSADIRDTCQSAAKHKLCDCLNKEYLKSGKECPNSGQAEDFKASLGESAKEHISIGALENFASEKHFTWHEVCEFESRDQTDLANKEVTMQLVPTAINSKFLHLGGTAEIKAFNNGSNKMDHPPWCNTRYC
ncbi:MAG: HNH endonuclease, partial [Sporomusaceae bacterium]|nr:HNH endonuclease [Sporomusaceae bacterium]